MVDEVKLHKLNTLVTSNKLQPNEQKSTPNQTTGITITNHLQSIINITLAEKEDPGEDRQINQIKNQIKNESYLINFESLAKKIYPFFNRE